jgi:FKBP-type peptidyl-prolyl cis-trans isomerase FklB
MKKILILILILVPLVVLAQGTQPTQTSPFKTQKEKLSYSIGLNIGANLKSQGIEVDPQIVAKALADVYAGKKAVMSEAEVQETLTTLQNDMKTKAQAQADDNKKKGDAFLAANGKKPGVVTLPSGLQYKVIKNGTGPKPKSTDSVVANYRGTLLNGTEFDSSYKRNQPATFPLNGIIKGWTEALQLMPVGSKWQLFIPPALAYGERGAGGVIGPNETLIFEVELVSIKQAQSQP